jgi:hypothetical protein
LYEADPRYGDGVRRVSVAGQNLLYEVDDQAQTVNILAVVGQRQQPRLKKCWSPERVGNAPDRLDAASVRRVSSPKFEDGFVRVE